MLRISILLLSHNAALNLLYNIKVEAIVGGQTSEEANLFAELGEAAKVPILSLSEHSASPSFTDRYTFFIYIMKDETCQVMGISALVEVLKWRDAVLLYEDTEHGRATIPYLVNALQKKNIHIAYESFIAPSTNEIIIEELQKLKALKTKVFVVHMMSNLLAPRLFLNAKKLGMMSESYAWIMTSFNMNFMHSMDSTVIESIQGLLGFKSCIPASTSLHNLTSRLRRKFYKEEPSIEVREVSPNGIWAYDATWALAEAVERAKMKILQDPPNMELCFSEKYCKRDLRELVGVHHDLQTNKTYVTGFCIDVFKAVIEALPYKVHYKFIPFEDANGNMAGTYNELVYQVHLQKFDAVVGDTTITWNRSLYVDFTVPFTDLGMGTLVPKEEETMWIFLKPLSADLWITSAGFFILTGFVVWIIEKPVNQEFQGSPSQQIGTIFWFSFSTLVFAHREKLLNNSAKFVVIIWVFVVLILNSNYTATLTSMMTVKQIQFNSKLDYVGYQIGTFTKLGLIDFDFKGLEQFNQSEEAYIDALSRGNKPGGASAIIDEIPYIKIFLAKYSSKYSMINTKSTTNGFGFVFPKGSKLAQDMSRQIEILREGGKLLEMEDAWFHSKSNLLFNDKTSDPSALNFHSLHGLFLVSGVSSAFAPLIHSFLTER
ncbi:unnamed protein product [Prunus armeniaca]|uniref:Ionotropic glutamate receptor C-terminal domain-containing protein n=1 Tax=Prunus armeniaca TaxID=36596 RepID=A0A6J5WIB8_PRUAR|nr:unnamed protein product [Prunus armeniaca]